MPQRSVPCVYMRGGTSRALFFHRSDLPVCDGEDFSAWNEIFCGAIGSPDPYRRQLNGVGGGITSLSKVAVVSRSERNDADVDYTFGQVDVTEPIVGYRGNCGNISSAVGPFAVDEGLVQTKGTTASVRIYNTNTRKIIRADFDLEDGKAAVNGSLALAGVAGTGSPISLAFLAPGGAVTGRLLPTGNVRDTLVLPQFGEVVASFVDACNPVVFIRADAVGLTGLESPETLAAESRTLALLEEVRVAAAVAMGIVTNAAEARTKMRNLPFVALMAARPAASLVGGADVVTRMLSSGQPHKAVPLTGALCLAVAAAIEGSIVQDATRERISDGPLVVGHASGTLPVAARVAATRGGPVAEEAIGYRTARRLMEGRVFIPG